MYDEEFIAMNYKPIQIIENRIGWNRLQTDYKIRKKFSSVMKNLNNKGYVDDHGKSGDVYSLTYIGVAYVKGIGKK
jgi:hypothetical protein